MVMRAIFSGSTQIFEEVCEHCGEKVRDIHVSEITTKAPNDPRSFTIRDARNTAITMKTKLQKIVEVTESYKRRGLLDDAEAADAFTNQKLKYGLRPEAMCSESIDLDAGVTQSFCYRVEATPNATFTSKVVGGRTLSASLARFEKSDITGSRMGVDRKGNVIKMNRFKNVNMQTGETEKDSSGAEIERKKGGFETSWFAALNARDRERVIRATQGCRGMITTYGDEVKTMKVVTRARNLADFDRNFIQANGCRL